MNRRTFLTGALGACTPKAPIVMPHAEIEEVAIAELSARMARGEITSRALTEKYLARIESIDRSGPSLHAVLEINPDAAAIASALDDERRAKGARGPLHGIPILVKDNIDTSDRMQTTAGSLALASAPRPRDAAVVARLREAGAVILGKTNLSEWANIRGSPSTSGWSARGGLTKNPYFLDRNASGSSSGSAAAVSASLCAAALGTETDGSIVSPSSVCGLVGIKTTVGLLDRAGIIPISHTQDTAGPMARTVADAAALLSVLAGKSYSLDPNGARGVRIGVLRKDPTPPMLTSALDAAVEVLRKLGATIVDALEIKHIADVSDPELEVLLTELRANLAKYLHARGGPRTKLEDVVKFNTENAAAEMPWFGQELFEKALKMGDLQSPKYVAALATCRKIAREEGIDALITKDKLDALVSPAESPAWLTDFINGDHVTWSGSTPAAVAGVPSITVPCGNHRGLPLGILFFGAANTEAKLINIAFAYEQATKHRKPPQYKPTIEF